MRFFMTGPSGSWRVPWTSYAVLRDTVQHYLERGTPSDRFQALHALEVAMDHGSHRIDAARLRGEVLEAWRGIGALRVEKAAVSARTRNILATVREARDVRRSTLGKPRAAADAPVLERARPFVAAVLRATASAVNGDTVMVRREGPLPSSARAAGQA